MIKGFGVFSFLIFLILCKLIGEFGPGIPVWFLSFLLVGSGVTAYSLFLFPQSMEEHGFRKLKAFVRVSPVDLINSISDISAVVRKDGLLATESLRKDLKDHWLEYALKKMIDGYDKAVIVQVIRNEHLRFHEQFMIVESYKERITNTISLFGLAGSLSHLMYFLSKDDPTLIGASFVPFLLSIIIQLCFGAWAQSQIDYLVDQSRVYYGILENGVAGIQDGVNSDVLRDQLMARITHA
jgi:flagellar motor component MotA